MPTFGNNYPLVPFSAHKWVTYILHRENFGEDLLSPVMSKKGWLIAGLLVAAAGTAAAYAAPSLVKAAKAPSNYDFIVGMARLHKYENGLLKIYIPATIYNRTGFDVVIERLRFRVFYNDGKDWVLLAISPTVIPTVTMKNDDTLVSEFAIDIIPTALPKIKRNTQLKITTDFDFKEYPVTINQTGIATDFFPAVVFNIAEAGGNLINTATQWFNNLFGMGCPDTPQGMSCGCQHKALSGFSNVTINRLL